MPDRHPDSLSTAEKVVRFLTALIQLLIVLHKLVA